MSSTLSELGNLAPRHNWPRTRRTPSESCGKLRQGRNSRYCFYAVQENHPCVIKQLMCRLLMQRQSYLANRGRVGTRLPFCHEVYVANNIWENPCLKGYVGDTALAESTCSEEVKNNFLGNGRSLRSLLRFLATWSNSKIAKNRRALL